MKALTALSVMFYVVVERQELEQYSEVIPKNQLLVLDPAFQTEYDTFDKLGDTKSKGPGAARNFAWEHSISSGHKWHWVMDDNILQFFRLNQNLKVRVAGGAIFQAMEDFCLRYSNVAMAGPNYAMFAKRRQKLPPFIVNTRIYSCNLIRNDVPFRWRGRYNEDTDLSIRMLKGKWVTVQFNAFLQDKITTQKMKGGNTKEFYSAEGTLPKSQMIVDMHPDIAKHCWRFGRAHHYVDYSSFKSNKLRRQDGLAIGSGPNNYGMKLVQNK